MRTTLLVCFLAFLALAGSLQAADPFVGTWKLNVAKSNPIPAPPGMALKEQTEVVQATSQRYDLTFKGTRENGSANSIRFSAPLKGGPVVFTEGGPPAGASVALKRISGRTVDFITTRDGKVVLTRRVTVSANGKTMRTDEKGVDAQGKPVQALYLSDKQ
jgi:hypothetical protein